MANPCNDEEEKLLVMTLGCDDQHYASILLKFLQITKNLVNFSKLQRPLVF